MMRADRQGFGEFFKPVSPSTAAGEVASNGSGPAAAYMATELATAPPWRLGVMLYDGAISLCRQAVEALDAGEISLAADRLARARQIMQQLQHTLTETGPEELRERFTELYERAHRRLIEADFYRRREAVTDAISMLSYQRATWGDFVESLSNRPPAENADLPQSCWIG